MSIMDAGCHIYHVYYPQLKIKKNLNSGNEWKMMIFVHINQQCIQRYTILYIYIIINEILIIY